MSMDQIIIRQQYFDNIKSAVDGINQFFESEFQTKNFPTNTSELDWAIANIVELLEDLDPSYVSDNSRFEDTIDMINEKVNDTGDMSNMQIMSNRPIRNAIESVISYAALSDISNNFGLFSNFINGIYTFELFMKPSQYRNEIRKFTNSITVPEELMDLDIDTSLFDVESYVSHLMSNPDITFPETMNEDAEASRILEFRDLQNVEVVVADKTESAPTENNPENPVQEGVVGGAVIGSFLGGPIGAAIGTKIAMNKEKKKQEQLVNDSTAVKNTANKIMKNTNVNNNNTKTKQVGSTPPEIPVKESYVSEGAVKNASKEVGKAFVDVVGAPASAANAMVGHRKNVKEAKQTHQMSDKHFPVLTSVRYDVSSQRYQISAQAKSFADKLISDLKKLNSNKELHDYLKRLTVPRNVDIPLPHMIVEKMDNKNRGIYSTYMTLSNYYGNIFLKRIKSIDEINHINILYLFNVDKDAVIQFISDFLYLNLINNPRASINNKKILRLFDIWDSKLYIYNVLNTRYRDLASKNLDAEYKRILNRIDQNSKAATVYETNTNPKDSLSKSIKESTELRLKEYGDVTVESSQYCESFAEILYDEISTISDVVYNNGYSINEIDEFIGESYDIFEEALFTNRPAARGEVPAYMLSRMDVSAGEKSPNKDMEEVPVENPVIQEPKNSVDELADSIDEKMDMNGDADELLGSGFKQHQHGNQQDGRIVYNVTYNNSFNRSSSDSHNVKNDLSSEKSVNSTTTNTNSNNRTSNSNNATNSKNTINRPEIPPKNNNDNSNDSLDTKEFDEHAVVSYKDRKFSNGMTVEEMFTFLESEEPLSNEYGATAGDLPREDSLTRAMDRDRKSLPKRQEAKRKFQKFGNTARAKTKGLARTKLWLTNVVNSLVERDENKVKEEIIENPSYRTSLYKALRLAVKLGLTGVAFTVSTWLGTGVAALQLARYNDKARLRREVQDEMVTELKILDEKIDYAKRNNNQDELYKLMRIKGKLTGVAADASRGRWVTIKPKRNWY